MESIDVDIKNNDRLKYIQYSQELEGQYLDRIRQLISGDLSEPYSIYVYRYFLNQWGHLAFLVGFKHTALYKLLLKVYRLSIVQIHLSES